MSLVEPQIKHHRRWWYDPVNFLPDRKYIPTCA